MPCFTWNGLATGAGEGSTGSESPGARFTALSSRDEVRFSFGGDALFHQGDFEKALADPQQLGIALSEQIALGDWRLLFQGRDNLNKITSKQVAEAAAIFANGYSR